MGGTCDGDAASTSTSGEPMPVMVRPRVGSYGRPEGRPGTAARLEAGNCEEGFTCLFQVCAVLSHQACADGSVFFPSAVQGGSVGTHIVYAAYFGPFFSL